MKLLDAGLNLSKLELVGFSIGAQIAGFAARIVKSSSRYIVPRVVGLEPAKFAPINLSSADADFVVTIHTGNVFGESSVVGHANFWVNSGVEQPMCTFFYMSK